MCLTTHITDVVNTVVYEDLSGIVLLGFSYGGFVVTGALETSPNGCGTSSTWTPSCPVTGTRWPARRPGDGYGVIGPGRDWLVPPLPREFDDPAEAAWAGARRTPQPVGCFTEPVRLARPLEDYPFTRTYIKATGSPGPSPAGRSGPPRTGARPRPAWRYREIATGHMVASNRPAELARLLLELT